MPLVNDKAVFELSSKGESTGRVYSGKFVMKLFLSLRDRSAAAVEFSKLNEGNTQDQEVAFLNRMLSEFSLQAEESPEWFRDRKVLDIEDFSPLLAIKEELEKSQREYSDKINK